jgi:hypothetical protein
MISGWITPSSRTRRTTASSRSLRREQPYPILRYRTTNLSSTKFARVSDRNAQAPKNRSYVRTFFSQWTKRLATVNATCVASPEGCNLLSERRFGRPHGSRKVERLGHFCTLASLMQFECYLDAVLHRQEPVSQEDFDTEFSILGLFNNAAAFLIWIFPP